MIDYPEGLSVILTTWNRAESLKKTLAIFQTLTPPNVPWELIVVDNGSTDHTCQIIESFSNSLPIVYEFETKSGQCEARNAGIRRSRYELVIFTDDDITPSQDWLVAYANALDTQMKEAFGGGPIKLDLSACEIPQWARNGQGDLQPWVAAGLAQHDLSQVDSSSWMFYGGNMAYRHFVFDRFGLFDPRVGHTRERRFGAEEVLLQIKLRKNGLKAFYVPDALVWHRIRQDELTFGSRLKRVFLSNQGKARALYISGEDVRFNLRRTLRHGRNLVHMLPGLFSQSQSRRFETLYRMAAIYGYEMHMLVNLKDI